MLPRSRRHIVWRRFRAGIRDTWVVLRQFRRPLLIFFVVMFAAAVLYRGLTGLAQTSNSAIRQPSIMEAFYLMLSMIFLQANVEFPDVWYLEVFFFVMPVIGIALLGTGVANLGVLLFNKSARGKEWEVALASTFSNHVIVVGLGKLGYRVVQQLLEFGQGVVAMELDPNKPFIPLVREMGVPVIITDARRAESLVSAGIDRAGAVVCCTQDDLANLDIALDARERHPNIKIVLRMFDADLARKVERGFGIHTVFSMSTLAAPAFAAAATRAHVDYSFHVDGQLLHVAQLAVDGDSRLAGQTVEAVERTYEMTVVMHRHQQGRHLHPRSDEVLNAGDSLVILASLEALGRLGLFNRLDEQGVSIRSGRRNWLRRLFRRANV
jgi:Trk K+ transport system NAD-binding subunit